MRHTFAITALGACLALNCATLSGQSVTGPIRGEVVDHSGAAVPGAAVELTNPATGSVMTAATNPETGLFIFPSVFAGSYTLQVKSRGFKTHQVRDIALAASEARDMGRITLAVGEVAESIMVRDTPAPLQLASSEKSGTVTGTQLNELSLKGRDFFGLMTLIPGVVDNGSQSRDSTSANAIGGIYINGGRSEMKNITVDAVTSISAGSNNNTPFQPNMDAIAEVRVLTSNYQAEYGRSGAGLISVITKSGGREFHGTGWWTHRHEQFNANTFFRNRAGQPKTPYRYDIFGLSAGGPVYVPRKFNTERNKIFFFFTQENTRQQTDYGTQLINMPTEAERGGDFSKSIDTTGRLIPVVDPITRAAFPGNIVPASRINRLGQSILKFFPLPNYTDPDPARLYRQNYYAAASGAHPRINRMIRFDAYPSSKLYGYYRYIKDNDSTEYPFTYYNFNYSPALNEFPGKGHAAHLIYTASPRVLNDFSIGQWGGRNRWIPKEPEKVFRSVIGNIPQWYENKLQTDIESELIDSKKMPNMSFGGTPVGPPSINTTGAIHYNPGNNWEITDNVSWVRGNHNLKGGIHLGFFGPKNMNGAQWNGQFNFGVNASNPYNTGHSYANALLGYFNTYTESDKDVYFRNTNLTIEWFVQDNWRVSRRLTLDLGVRFYRLKPTVDQNYSFATFDPKYYDPAKAPRLYVPGTSAGQRVALDPATGATTFAALIGVYVPGSGDTANGQKVGGKDGYPWGLYTMRPLSAAPRFGFAYDLFGTGKTVLRGGVGTFIDRPRNVLINANTPPLGYTPVAYYGHLDTFAQSAGAIGPSALNVIFPVEDAKYPSVTSFSLAVQRQLPFASTIDVSYVGSVGTHLLQARNINDVARGARFLKANEDPTRPGTPLPDNFFRPYRGLGQITIYEFGSSSNYHSLQVSAQRRFTSGLGFGAAYTFSKALGVASIFNEGVSNYFPARNWEYGPLGHDRSQVLTLNYLYEIPGLGKRLRNAFVSAIADRWTLSGITSFMSGAPFTPGFSTTTAMEITGSSEGARITVVGDPKLSKGEKSFYRNFRQEAFALTPVGSFGNAGVGVLRGPGINNWNLSLNKTIPIGLGEGRVLRFRSEFYNAFNHTQFSGLDTGARFDPQGRQGNANFGAFTGAREPRVISFALRVQF